MGIRARKTAEIAALAGADAGDEERRVVLLGLQDAGAGERQQRRGGEDREFQLGGHGFSLLKASASIRLFSRFFLGCPGRILHAHDNAPRAAPLERITAAARPWPFDPTARPDILREISREEYDAFSHPKGFAGECR